MQTRKLSNGQEVWMSTFTGEVVSSDTSSAMSIHQDAATVLRDKLVIPGTIHSRTTVSHEVWLRSADGKELQVDLGAIGLPLRPGHVVTVAWGATQSLKQGSTLGARNHDTGEVRCDVLKAVGGDLKGWKLDVGAAGSFWRWTISGTVVGAIVGGLWGRAAASAHSVPQDTLFGILALGIPAFILTALLWLCVGMHLLLNGKVTTLVGEINDFLQAQLGSAEPKPGGSGRAKTAGPVQSQTRPASAVS